MLEAFKKYIAKKGDLIDIGCGEKPYKKMLEPFVNKHIGVDHISTVHDKTNIDVFSDIYSIPLEDESFMYVLCTEVFSHLEKPDVAMAEISRLLKKDGYAFITFPFIWHYCEEPRDFYRYTKHGMRYLAEKNNLRLIEIRQTGGLFFSFFTELAYCINELLGGDKIDNAALNAIKSVIFCIIFAITSLIDLIDPTKKVFPVCNIVVLKK